MTRHVFRLVLGVALALGLSFTTAEVVGPAHAAPTAADLITSAAPDCSNEQAAYDDAVAKKRMVRAKLTRATKRLRAAKRALQRAKAAGAHAKVVKLKKKVKRLKGLKRRLQRRLQRRKAAVATTKAALDACLDGGGGGTTDDPLQQLCTAGIPQPICDALADLVGGGLPDLTSVQALCDAVPEAQPLCDALSGGTPDLATLTEVLQPILDALGLGDLLGGGLPDIQALCDAGVPQQICDALAGEAGGLPTDVTIDELCDAVPEAQPLCDAFAGGTPDPTTLLAVLEDVLIAMGLGDLLGGGLPDIQALCDAGVPQQICDALAGEAGGLPTDVTIDELCEAVPEAQPLCDAFAGGTPDATTLLAVLEGVLLALGLGDLLDLLGGLPLPRMAA